MIAVPPADAPSLSGKRQRPKPTLLLSQGVGFVVSGAAIQALSGYNLCMPKTRSNTTPPVKKTCPTDSSGEELCDFYYEAISARETDGDWLAQFCKNCKHLMFIDKKKLAHGASS